LIQDTLSDIFYSRTRDAGVHVGYVLRGDRIPVRPEDVEMARVEGRGVVHGVPTYRNQTDVTVPALPMLI
jgi:hypothetical protein